MYPATLTPRAFWNVSMYLYGSVMLVVCIPEKWMLHGQGRLCCQNEVQLGSLGPWFLWLRVPGKLNLEHASLTSHIGIFIFTVFLQPLFLQINLLFHEQTLMNEWGLSCCSKCKVYRVCSVSLMLLNNYWSLAYLKFAHIPFLVKLHLLFKEFSCSAPFVPAIASLTSNLVKRI